ncbi:MAG: hypothetical protein KME31_09110 [Tolypothrix carrinoi HA7290-LM1]|nr:hypothetical protein [Tolypothrix carrinoi HA7290-LM1]
MLRNISPTASVTQQKAAPAPTVKPNISVIADLDSGFNVSEVQGGGHFLPTPQEF